MYNYIFLNTVVLSFVSLFIWSRKKRLKNIFKPMLVIVFLTAIFDSLIVGFNLVNYDAGRILGLFIFNAPVEDFAYSLVAVLLVAHLWEHNKNK